jgi:protein gp37
MKTKGGFARGPFASPEKEGQMAKDSAISWTDHTWNPTTGCSRVSEGCRNCYAERLSLKWGWSKKPWTKKNEPFNVIEHEDRLRFPMRLKEPARIFVNSMSDCFNDQVSDDFISRIFQVMQVTPQHIYQILTKRPERAAKWPGPWPPHVWMGTSVEDSRVIHRIDTLRQCKAKVRFISAEPLIGPLEPLNLKGIHWVIVGGESGAGHRPMKQEWARAIRDECVKRRVAFFYKQDSAGATEMRPWLVEADGSRWVWHQFPGKLDPPTRVTK